MSVSHETEHGDPAGGGPDSWFSRLLHRVGDLVSHEHDHSSAASHLHDSGAEGIRATKVSLVGLAITALVQAVIFLFSGSVALLSDTVHNLADALTAIPLWVAFALGRRQPTRRYTYGFNRAEDVAGLLIVVAIGASAGLVIWESVRRLAEPRLMDHIPWVIAAGLVGALGNELVARYRIMVGRDIGSEALIVDGHHARSDALTSLAVVAAGVGAAFEVAWIDPVAGLIVAAAILWILVRSTRRIARRVLDGIDPEIVDDVESTIRGVPGVRGLTDVRVRWHGHQLRIAASIAVDDELTVRQGHDLAHEAEEVLQRHFSVPVNAMVHVYPHDGVDTPG